MTTLGSHSIYHTSRFYFNNSRINLAIPIPIYTVCVPISPKKDKIWYSFKFYLNKTLKRKITWLIPVKHDLRTLKHTMKSIFIAKMSENNSKKQSFLRQPKHPLPNVIFNRFLRLLVANFTPVQCCHLFLRFSTTD